MGRYGTDMILTWGGMHGLEWDGDLEGAISHVHIRVLWIEKEGVKQYVAFMLRYGLFY